MKSINVGNYWADVIRPTFRFLLPICMVWALFLNSQGVPATFQGGPDVQVVDQTAELKTQKIPLTKIQKNNSGLIIQVTLKNGIVINKKTIY